MGPGAVMGRKSRAVSVGAALILSPLLLASCGGNSTKVTGEFTSRMSQVEGLRTRVEGRVSTLKSDCSQRLLLQTVCDAGVNFYTDSLEAPVNSWISEVQADVTDKNSLKNLVSYDEDLDSALTQGEQFIAWVDDVHSHRFPPTSGGARGGPSIEDVGKIAIAAGTEIWKTYEAGRNDHTDRLVARMDQEKFRSYEAIGS